MDDDTDLSEYDAILVLDTIEVLPMDGMPTNGHQVFADERLLVRVTVENIGDNASNHSQHLWISVDDEARDELTLPDIQPNQTFWTEWHTKQPLGPGHHRIRAQLDLHASDSDTQKNQVHPIQVLGKMSPDHKDYGVLKETAKTRCDEAMTKAFVADLEQGLKHFVQSANQAIDRDIKEHGESEIDVAPIFEGVFVAILGAFPGVTELKAAVGIVRALYDPLRTNLLASASHSEAQKITKARERLHKAVENLDNHASAAFIKAWKEVDKHLDELVTEAIAALDAVPDMGGHKVDEYWDRIRMHVGIPEGTDIDLAPLYNSFRELDGRVMRHLYGPNVEPTI